jgi:hypothetical protein
LNDDRLAGVGDDHAAAVLRDQLVDQIARYLEGTHSPCHRQVRLVEVEQVARGGSRDDRRSVGRARRAARGSRAGRTRGFVQTIEPELPYLSEVNLDPEVVGGEVGDDIGRPDHRDVDLSQAGPRPLLETDLPGPVVSGRGGLLLRDGDRRRAQCEHRQGQ